MSFVYLKTAKYFNKIPYNCHITTNNTKCNKSITLKNLGLEITLHDKMPDVVLYSEEND